MSTPAASSAANEINRLHREAVRRSNDSRAALCAALEAAWQAGRLLNEEKRRVRRAMGRGAWLLWLESNFQGTPRTAQRYMQLARSEADASRLCGMSLRQAYWRLGIATEPKSRAGRAPVENLPAHVRFAHKLVLALKSCVSAGKVTPAQCAHYRQDLRPLYDLLCPLFEAGAPSLAFPAITATKPHEVAPSRPRARHPVSPTHAGHRRKRDRGAVPPALPALRGASALDA